MKLFLLVMSLSKLLIIASASKPAGKVDPPTPSATINTFEEETALSSYTCSFIGGFVLGKGITADWEFIPDDLNSSSQCN